MATKTTVATSARSLIDTFRDQTPAPFPLALKFDDCRILLHSSSSELVETLTLYFQEFLGDDKRPDIEVTAIETLEQLLDLPFKIKKPDPGKKKIKEEYVDFPDGRVVRKRLTGMLFIFSGELHLGVGPCIANANQVINFIISRYIQWTLHRGGLLMHAAAVEKNGRGLAIAGFSGMGKSTLALHLMSRGFTFVSNDRLMVRVSKSGVRMYGVPKLPRINPGTALNNPDLRLVIPKEDQEKFRRLEGEALWELEHKYDVYIDEVFGPGKFALSASLAGLVVLNWKRNGATTEAGLVPLAKRPDLFPAFTKSTGLFYADKPGCEPSDFLDGAYHALLNNIDLLEVTGSIDFDLAADACMALLENG